MFKVLTKCGIHQTASEQTARSIAINAARSGEAVVLVTTSDEYIVRQEPRGSVMAYCVADARTKNELLMEEYREICFRAYLAEEEKSKKAAANAARKAVSSRYEELDSNWMEKTFNSVFGDLVGLTKKK